MLAGFLSGGCVRCECVGRWVYCGVVGGAYGIVVARLDQCCEWVGGVVALLDVGMFHVVGLFAAVVGRGHGGCDGHVRTESTGKVAWG